MTREEYDPQYVELIMRLGKSYSREQRYLLTFRLDFEEYMKRGEWFRNNLEKARKDSKMYWDFLCSWDSLNEKMQEFRWTKDFLKANGIDFPAIRNLYFAVA